MGVHVPGPRVASFILGAITAAALLATCSTGASAPDGSVMDIRSADAQQQGTSQVFKADCDKVAVGSNNAQNTFWFADVTVPGLDPSSAPSISYVLCEPECWGSGCGTPPCLGEATCRNTGWAPPESSCIAGPAFLVTGALAPLVETGRVVVPCGFRQNLGTLFGRRFRRAFVRIQQ